MRINFSDAASAILLRVSVDFNDTPDRIVTPVNAELLLKDSTVTATSSPDIVGTKHSIPDMVSKYISYKNKNDN